jgi:hypothetical protein
LDSAIIQLLSNGSNGLPGRFYSGKIADFDDADLRIGLTFPVYKPRGCDVTDGGPDPLLISAHRAPVDSLVDSACTIISRVGSPLHMEQIEGINKFADCLEKFNAKGTNFKYSPNNSAPRTSPEKTLSFPESENLSLLSR